MSFKKILAAIDFSTQSREALRVAAMLASESHAELTLLHVWEAETYTSSPSFAMSSGIAVELLAETERALADWKHRAVALGATNVTSRVVDGVAWDRIVDVAKTEPAYDLIVIGTHGRTGLAHVLIGSVAEKVVRHAQCPVLVVRAAR